jgi:hypothetical protein
MHPLLYLIEFADPSPFVYSAYLHPTFLQDPFGCLLPDLMPTYKQYPWQPQLMPFAD